MRRLLAPSRPDPLALMLLALAALCVLVAGFQHARLFHRGYAEVEIVGLLFFMNAIGSTVVVLTLISRARLDVRPRRAVDLRAVARLDRDLALRRASSASARAATTATRSSSSSRRWPRSCSRWPARRRGGAGRCGASDRMRLVLAALVVRRHGLRDHRRRHGRGAGRARRPRRRRRRRGGASSGSPPAAPPCARGRALFEDEGCDRCHSIAATGADGKLGPRLDAIDDDADDIAEAIVEPREDIVDGFPEQLMPDDFGERLERRRGRCARGVRRGRRGRRGRGRETGARPGEEASPARAAVAVAARTPVAAAAATKPVARIGAGTDGSARERAAAVDAGGRDVRSPASAVGGDPVSSRPGAPGRRALDHGRDDRRLARPRPSDRRRKSRLAAWTRWRLARAAVERGIQRSSRGPAHPMREACSAPRPVSSVSPSSPCSLSRGSSAAIPPRPPPRRSASARLLKPKPPPAPVIAPVAEPISADPAGPARGHDDPGPRRWLGRPRRARPEAAHGPSRRPAARPRLARRLDRLRGGHRRPAGRPQRRRQRAGAQEHATARSASTASPPARTSRSSPPSGCARSTASSASAPRPTCRSTRPRRPPASTIA